jgi:hypothetical protein
VIQKKPARLQHPVRGREVRRLPILRDMLSHADRYDLVISPFRIEVTIVENLDSTAVSESITRNSCAGILCLCRAKRDSVRDDAIA